MSGDADTGIPNSSKKPQGPIRVLSSTPIDNQKWTVVLLCGQRQPGENQVRSVTGPGLEYSESVLRHNRRCFNWRRVKGADVPFAHLIKYFAGTTIHPGMHIDTVGCKNVNVIHKQKRFGYFPGRFSLFQCLYKEVHQ